MDILCMLYWQIIYYVITLECYTLIEALWVLSGVFACFSSAVNYLYCL